MVRNQLRLRLRSHREHKRQYRRNLFMIVLPGAFEQRLIRCLPNQRMPESIERRSITSLLPIENMSPYQSIQLRR